MSDGHFDYQQYHIGDIADSIENIIERNGKPTPWDDLDEWDRREYDYDERTYENSENKHVPYDYPPEVIERFREGLRILRRAYIYAQRIDWLLSCDDGEDDFIERLDEELKNLEELEKKE